MIPSAWSFLCALLAAGLVTLSSTNEWFLLLNCWLHLVLFPPDFHFPFLWMLLEGGGERGD